MRPGRHLQWKHSFVCFNVCLEMIEREVHLIHDQIATTNAKVPVGITASSALTLLFFVESRVLCAVVDKNISSDFLSAIFQVHSTHIQ
jgi:hypothetical protein